MTPVTAACPEAGKYKCAKKKTQKKNVRANRSASFAAILHGTGGYSAVSCGSRREELGYRYLRGGEADGCMVNDAMLLQIGAIYDATDRRVRSDTTRKHWSCRIRFPLDLAFRLIYCIDGLKTNLTMINLKKKKLRPAGFHSSCCHRTVEDLSVVLVS